MPVPRLSFYTIDYHARQVLAEFQPDALVRPEPLDFRGLWRFGLSMLGADTDVGSAELMGAAEAWTMWSDGSPIVLLRKDQYEALMSDGEPRQRANINVAHETGHVVLHGDHGAKRYMLSPDSMKLPEGCEEYQAWAFAGCLSMPCEVIRGLESLDPPFLSDLFHVSPQMARCHLYRMKRAGML